jgi:ankyrin repeat protein
MAAEAVADAAASGSRPAPPAALARAPSAALTESGSTSPSILAARLRDAAAGGRISEIAALLAQGAAVDAADAEGETALMKAVKANHAPAVALLRRRGADPDLKNLAGTSPRDMAARIGDPDLDRALGVDR